ncbi:MAG: ArsA family ATPase [Angustibacter sp.]
MRVLVFTGKGGVGKTTVSAATAAHAARQGVKTLVVSTDAAHSLGDALGVELEPDAVQEVEPGLSAVQVDTRARLAGSWSAVRSYLVDVLAALDVDPADADELAALPGADDVATLLALREHAADAAWDLVVVDCAPTADTLRLLALPEALGRFVDRVVPAHRRLARALAPAVGLAAGVPAPGRDVLGALLRLRGELQDALSVVRSPQASVRLVLTPEAVVLAEARRTLTALSLHGFVVDGVVANRVIPDEPGSAWQQRWVRAQAGVLAEVRDSFGGLPVCRLAYQPEEPVGVEALAALGADVVGAAGVEALLQAPQGHEPLRVERLGDDYELVLRLPLTRAGDVELARRDDELVVGVGSLRRVLALPSVLRRCDVAGARFAGDALHVRFVRDADLWPAS